MTTIKELKKDLQPYEKFVTLGPEVLTDAELLAIIIRSGTSDKTSIDLANEIIDGSKEGSILSINHISLQELMNIKGIGKVKAIEIKAVGELSRRISKSSVPITKDLSSPELIASRYMEDLRHLEIEHLIMVMLNTKYKFIGDCTLSKGTVNFSVASPREAYIEALKNGAVYICLIHNHPSGDPTPSREDIKITKRMADAGKLIGITLIDHIIIGDNIFFSMKQKQLF